VTAWLDEALAKRRADRLKEQPKARPEPKWGIDRRRTIVMAMADTQHGASARYDVIRYIRKSAGAGDMVRFFEIATEEQMTEVERILKI